MPCSKPLPILLLATLTAGCAGASMIHTSYYESAYTPGHVQLAAIGDVLAVIRDNPFPADRDNAGVVAAMQARNIGPKMHFTQVERPDDRYGYKVVLDFGGSGGGYGYGYGGICRAEPTPPTSRPPMDRIWVTGAFCVGDTLLTEAYGSVGEASGPTDPRFRNLVSDVLVALTPPYDPKRGDDDRCRGFGC
jgi:hypothetical protein